MWKFAVASICAWFPLAVALLVITSAQEPEPKRDRLRRMSTLAVASPLLLPAILLLSGLATVLSLFAGGGNVTHTRKTVVKVLAWLAIASVWAAVLAMGVHQVDFEELRADGAALYAVHVVFLALWCLSAVAYAAYAFSGHRRSVAVS